MSTPRTFLAITAMVLPACVFGGGEAPFTSDGDAGAIADANGSDALGTERPDLETDPSPDDDAGGQIPDMAREHDTGRDVDAGPPDMGGPAAPYEVVREYDVGLGGQPSVEAPLRVARFVDGFLFAYHDQPAAKGRVGYLDPQKADVTVTYNFGASNPWVGLAGEKDRGYVSFSSGQTLGGFWLSLDSTKTAFVTDPTAYVSQYRQFFETSIALEKSTVYVAYGDEYLQPGSGLAILGQTAEPGFATQVDGLELREVEAIGGGAAVGRTIFAAGIATDYVNVEYAFDTQRWNNTLLKCGVVAPEAANGGRIVPARERWAGTLAPGPDGPRLSFVECGENDVARRVNFDLPGMGPLEDFDLALPGGNALNFAMVWQSGREVWFSAAAIDRDAGTSRLNTPWKIPNVRADRVRIAFNPDSNQWAIATTGTAGAKILVIEKK